MYKMAKSQTGKERGIYKDCETVAGKGKIKMKRTERRKAEAGIKGMDTNYQVKDAAHIYQETRI